MGVECKWWIIGRHSLRFCAKIDFGETSMVLGISKCEALFFEGHQIVGCFGDETRQYVGFFMKGWVWVLLAVFGLSGCEEFGGAISPQTLAAMQARTRRLTEIVGELKKQGHSVAIETPSTNEVRVPLRFKGTHPYIDVDTASGGRILMLFDTGASLSVMGPKDALKHGALFVDSRDVRDVMAEGIFGTEAFRPALVPQLKIGKWSVGAVPILVPAESAVVTPGSSLKIVGFNVPLKVCSYVTVNYLKKEAVFGFGQPYQPSGYARVRQSPMSFVRGVPTARLSVGNVSWDAILDTGSFNGIEINETVAHAMGRSKEGIGVSGLRLGGVGGVKSSEEIGLRYIHVPSLEACGMVHRNAQIDISRGQPRVGSFFFQDYKVTFDILNRRLWLEW